MDCAPRAAVTTSAVCGASAVVRVLGTARVIASLVVGASVAARNATNFHVTTSAVCGASVVLAANTPAPWRTDVAMSAVIGASVAVRGALMIRPAPSPLSALRTLYGSP